MKQIAIIVLLLIASAFLAGCTGTTAAGQDIAQDPIRAHFEHHGDWTPGTGCYEKVTGYAYNAGNTTMDRVMVNFNLINTQTGTIRDSREIYIGSLLAGQSATFETDLNGECTQDYRVAGTVLP
jgi:predicted small secreted protein